mmetsp:Transcript_42902/g.122711  ORF Transcript_42902/g.122711 Transcript_42902/m.122711 type:complete len:177 (-) Transcript_42902:31-561(-)
MASSPLRFLTLGALVVVVAATGCPEGSATCRAAQDAVNDEAMALLQVAHENKEIQSAVHNQTDKQNATLGWHPYTGGPCACGDGGSGWISDQGCRGYQDNTVCNGNSAPCQCSDWAQGGRGFTGMCEDGHVGCCGTKDNTACSSCTCSDGTAGAVGVCKGNRLHGCCGFKDGTKCN